MGELFKLFGYIFDLQKSLRRLRERREARAAQAAAGTPAEASAASGKAKPPEHDTR
jgi:hypothetical protein